MRPTVAPTRRRWLAFVLACLYVVSTGASLLHLAVVEHVRCADHGELVHADGDHAEAPLLLVAADGPSLAGTDLHGGAHTHDHCEVTPALEGTALPAPVAVALEAPAVASDEPRSLAVAVRAPALARYRVAPKTSPPVA